MAKAGKTSANGSSKPIKVDIHGNAGAPHGAGDGKPGKSPK